MKKLICTALVALMLSAIYSPLVAASALYVKQAGNVSYEAEIDVPNVDAVPTLTGVPISLDAEALWASLARQEGEETKIDTNTAGNRTFSSQRAEGYYNPRDGSFRFSTKSGRYVDTLLRYFLYTGSESTLSSEQNNPPFADMDAAVAGGISPLAGLGIDFKMIQAYVLASPTLNRMQRAAQPLMDEDAAAGMHIDRKETWGGDEAYYYLRYLPRVGGIEFYPFEYFPEAAHGGGISPPVVEAILSADGIEYYYISGMWQTKSSTDAMPILTVEKAMDKYNEKYNQLIGIEPIHVKFISLYYLPVVLKDAPFYRKLQFEPVYVFTKMVGTDSLLDEAINAYTGKEVL